MYKEIIDFARKNNLSTVENRKNSTIAGYICINADGSYDYIHALDKKERKSLSVPDFGTKAATAKQANPIIEKLEYIFDVTHQKHESYSNDIASGAGQCKSLYAIHQFMERYESDDDFRQKVCADIEESKLTSKDIVSWMIDGVKVEEMSDDWNGWLLEKVAGFNADKTESNIIISSFTGDAQVSIPPRAAPAIRNVGTDTKAVFGVARPCYVASAKEQAYQSYGFDGATEFQIGLSDAKALVAGLEYLLDTDAHRNKDFKVIYFYNDDVENLICESLRGRDDDDDDWSVVAEDSMKQFMITDILRAAWTGQIPDISDDMKSIQYYMCKFDAPSPGRYFMSNEHRGTYADLVLNLYQWYRDTCVVQNQKKKSVVKFYNILLNCISSRDAEDKNKAVNDEFSVIKSELLYAIYHNKQIPTILYHRALRYASMTFMSSKVKKDGTVSVPSNIRLIYVQIIKCYLIRKGYENIMPELTKNVSAAYACGRLFAVYEQLQYKYNKGKKLNRNLAQSYFAGAMRRPGMIFPILSDLGIVYINGVKDSDKIYYSRLIGEIMSEIGNVFPAAFNMDEQGSFVLGYYQQKAEFMKKKPDTNEDDSVESAEEQDVDETVDASTSVNE